MIPESNGPARYRPGTIRKAIGFAALMGALALLIFQAVQFQDPTDEDGGVRGRVQVLTEAAFSAAEDG